MMHNWLGALQPLNAADDAALIEGCGCTAAELLAPQVPAWDALARLALLMLGIPPLKGGETVPLLAAEMAAGGVPAAMWAAHMRAVIELGAAQPAPPLPEDLAPVED